MNSKGLRFFSRRAAVTGVAFLLASTAASAAEPKDVLVSAIGKGTDSEVISGGIAEYMRSKTRSTSPVLMTATVVKHFSQKDCARLRVTLHQENVPKKDGTVAPFEFSYEMNMCADGLPPADGVNWANVQVPPSGISPEDIK